MPWTSDRRTPSEAKRIKCGGSDHPLLEAAHQGGPLTYQSTATSTAAWIRILFRALFAHPAKLEIAPQSAPEKITT